MKLAVISFLLCVLPIALGLGRPRGVSLEKASFYEGAEFKCLSNGRAVPMDHVNDDYCDCEDGSDEPGTSACANGLFYCENKAYRGMYLLSSRVNDGICDCCDGSDEYDGTITCEDTCEKLYAAVRAEQEAFRETQEKGCKVKLEYIQQGRRAKDEKMSRLTELTKDKDSLVDQRNVLQAAKDEAEGPEKEAKDKHEQAWQAQKAERQKEKDAEAAAVAFAELDINQDNTVDFPELVKHPEFDIDSDGTVSDDEAREYLDENEQVDLDTFTNKIWPSIKEIYKPGGTEEKDAGASEETKDAGEEAADQEKPPAHNIPLDEITEGTPDNYDHRYDEEDFNEDEDDDDDDEDEDDYDEDDLDIKYDISKRRGRKPPSSSEKVDEEDKMPEYDGETLKLIAVADEARRNYEEADKKVRDVENEISGITKYLELDLGPEEEFSALKGQCFEYTDREYTYRFCPFEKTSQKPKGGGIETNLGNWGHWYGPEEDKYDAMKYENGQGCWNGPSRSCHVNLHCGAENALIGASEPSRCEYQFEFTTPARCSQPLPSLNVHEEL